MICCIDPNILIYLYYIFVIIIITIQVVRVNNGAKLMYFIHKKLHRMSSQPLKIRSRRFLFI